PLRISVVTISPSSSGSGPSGSVHRQYPSRTSGCHFVCSSREPLIAAVATGITLARANHRRPPISPGGVRPGRDNLRSATAAIAAAVTAAVAKEQPPSQKKGTTQLVSDPKAVDKADVVLVGAGIMSATLGALLRLLEPDWSITLVERLDGAAAESSDPWNNAGTGHSALCELNYTPELPDGSIDISKAIQVNEQFQVTRQFWAYAVSNGLLSDVRSFLNPIPHVSFVKGEANIDYLKRRHDAL